MKTILILPATISLVSLLGAQGHNEHGNVLKHYDGTAEATSRGDGPNTDRITVLQRYPWNQCCNRTKLCCVQVTLQDQDPSTPEYVILEVRRNDSSDPLFPKGKPDMSPGGLMFQRPYQLQFTSMVQTFMLDMDPYPCVDLPLNTTGSGPADDFYVGFTFAPNTAWPTSDGVSKAFS